MTRFGRGLLGATVGAALTLMIHPVSRPYVFSAFIAPSPAPAPSREGIPTDLVELTDWMTAVGDRFVLHRKLSARELSNAAAVAQQGARLDPDNAYWHQMLATLYHQLGNEAEAKRQWYVASNCTRWNDYQSTGLLRIRDRLAKDFGAEQAWQLAYVYYERNENAVSMINAYSHYVFVTSPLNTDAGLLMRAQNVLNGGVLRKGSRSIRTGDYGREMAEMACHPPDVIQTLNHHRLFLARVSMHDRLRKLGRGDLADQVHRIYQECDGWDAFESPQEAGDQAAELSFLSLLTAGAPSMFLVVGSVGAILWLLGRVVRRLERIHLVPALLAGAILGLGAYFITFLPLAAAATFLCCAFLTLTPKRERRLKIDDLGPMFGFTAGTLGLVFMVLLGAFVIGLGAPAISILPSLNVPHEYFGGSGVLLGLAIIVLAILLLLAPLFATALRVNTSFVLGMALRKFGSFLAYTALAGIVIGTPLCIYFDRENANTMGRLVTNEPVYYLSLQR